MRRSLAALAAVLLLSLASAVPAQAASAARLAVRISGHIFLPGTNHWIGVAILYADRPVTVPAATLTFHTDLPGVGLGETGTPGNCSTLDTAPDMQCHVGPGLVGPSGTPVPVEGWVTADNTVVAGMSGTLSVKVEAAGFATVTGTAPVRIGTPVDLSASGDLHDQSLKPGAAFTVHPQVTNTTDVEVRGAAILGYAQYAVATTTNYRNCYYLGGQLQACSFDQVLEPHATYRTTLSYRLRPDTFAPSATWFALVWQPGDEFADGVANQDFSGGGQLGPKGTGGVLRLEKVATAQAAAPPPQLDPDYGNNWLGMTIKATGKQGADLAAVGDTASGKAGAVVTVSVGLRNNGPATIDYGRLPEQTIGFLAVTIPTGSTAVKVPADCKPVTDGSGGDRWQEPGWPRYTCGIGSFLQAGHSYTRDFQLRIDRVIQDAKGAIGVAGHKADLHPNNDWTSIVLNPRSAGSGGGGGLPITGPPGAVLGAAGLLLIVGGLLLLRRRRTRFEA